MTTKPSPEEALAIKAERAREGEKALKEYAEHAVAVRERTAKLRALRLAKEATEKRSKKR